MKKTWLFIAITLFLLGCAGVILINMRFPVRHLDVIRANSGELEVSLVLAVIMAESSFREDVESRAGAQGLMQIMPDTAMDIAGRMGLDFLPEDIWRPEVNIAMGTFYLNHLLEMFGCLELALAAYNAGQGRVNEWLANPEFSQDGQSLDVIPFEETRNYLRRIRRNQRIYRVILTVTGRSR